MYKNELTEYDDETIKKDLCKAYYDEDELITLAEDVVYRRNENYNHLLIAYDINVDQLEAILIEMNYIGS